MYVRDKPRNLARIRIDYVFQIQLTALPVELLELLGIGAESSSTTNRRLS